MADYHNIIIIMVVMVGVIFSKFVFPAIAKSKLAPYLGFFISVSVFASLFFIPMLMGGFTFKLSMELVLVFVGFAALTLIPLVLKLLKRRAQKKQEQEMQNEESTPKSDSQTKSPSPKEAILNSQMLKNMLLEKEPTYIKHNIIHNKKTLLALLTQQKIKQSTPNLIFVQIENDDSKAHAIFALEALRINIANDMDDFDRAYDFISQTKVPYGIIELQTGAEQIIDILYLRGDIDIYDLSMEIRAQFDGVIPQAKWLNDEIFLLLYDNFRTQYIGDVSCYIGSIVGFADLNLTHYEGRKMIFGYIDRTEESEKPRAIACLKNYFDSDILEIAQSEYSSLFSMVAKVGKKSAQILFFSDEYDNDGREFDSDYFYSPYLELIDSIAEEECEEAAESTYGVNIIIDDTEEEYEDSPKKKSRRGLKKTKALESHNDENAQSVDSKRDETPLVLDTSTLQQIAKSMSETFNLSVQNMTMLGQLNGDMSAQMSYYYKERENALREIFKLSFEEFAKLTAAQFEAYQRELDSLIKEIVRSLGHFTDEIEVESTQALCDILYDANITYGIYAESFKFSSHIRHFELNRAFLFNLLRAGAKVEQELLKEAQDVLQWYISSHLQRYKLYCKARQSEDSKLYKQDYNVSEEQKESFVLNMPTTRILQEIVASLNAVLYVPETMRIQALNALIQEAQLGEWDMPQEQEVFVGEEFGENGDWHLLSYMAVKNNDEAFFAATEEMKKSLESGEQICFYEDILKYEDSLSNKENVDSQILHKRGNTNRKMVKKRLDKKGNEANDTLFVSIMSSDKELFEQSLKAGANISKVVSAKLVDKYENDYEQLEEYGDLYEGMSYFAAALFKMTSTLCLSYDIEFCESEEEHNKAKDILFSLHALNPDESKAQTDAKSVLEDVHSDMWWEMHKDPQEVGYEGDEDDEEALNTYINASPTLHYLAKLGEELGLGAEISWE